jgi:hypothetical protein
MRVGQALKSKAGKTYLKFEKAVTIGENEALFLSTPAEDIQFLLEAGKITQEEAEIKLAKVPSFVLYNIKQVTTNNVKAL